MSKVGTLDVGRKYKFFLISGKEILGELVAVNDTEGGGLFYKVREKIDRNKVNFYHINASLVEASREH